MCQQCSIFNMTESLLTQYASSLVIWPQPRLQILPLIAFLHKTLVQVKYFICPSNAYCILFYSPVYVWIFNFVEIKLSCSLAFQRVFVMKLYIGEVIDTLKIFFLCSALFIFIFIFFKNHICLFMCHLNPALFFKHFLITLLRSKLGFFTSIWPTFYNCSIIVTTVAEVVVVVIANHDVCLFCVEDSAWCIPCSAYASQ